MTLARESICVFWEPFPDFDPPATWGVAASHLGRFDEFQEADFAFARTKDAGVIKFWVYDRRSIMARQRGEDYVLFLDDPAKDRLLDQFRGLSFEVVHHPENELKAGDPAWDELNAQFTDEAYVLFKLVYGG